MTRNGQGLSANQTMQTGRSKHFSRFLLWGIAEASLVSSLWPSLLPRDTRELCGSRSPVLPVMRTKEASAIPLSCKAGSRTQTNATLDNLTGLPGKKIALLETIDEDAHKVRRYVLRYSGDCETSNYRVHKSADTFSCCLANTLILLTTDPRCPHYPARRIYETL